MNLHSNMFLLIPPNDIAFLTVKKVFTFQYVSINTGIWVQIPGAQLRGFTFQYVSINTQSPVSIEICFSHIYIPICFY